MTIDLTRLSPGDAVTALRSYPRRFRSEFAPVDDDERLEETAHADGPDGTSAVDAATDTVRTWRVLSDALRQIRVADTPIVPQAVVDPAERNWEAPVSASVVEVLDQLEQGSIELADAAEALSGDQWLRTADVASGGTVTAFDVVKEAVKVGHEGLDRVQRTLAAVRG
ncbi:MAG TPA: hypothetical protein VIY72_02280 [Acidimicrobiales bacterium]